EKTLEIEKSILTTLCFDFDCVHPFRFLMKLGPIYKTALGTNSQVHQTTFDELIQECWTVIGDIYRDSMLCIRYSPRLIAIGAIIHVCKKKSIDLPQIFGSKKDLFDGFFAKTNPQQLHKLCERIEEIYRKNLNK